MTVLTVASVVFTSMPLPSTVTVWLTLPGCNVKSRVTLAATAIVVLSTTSVSNPEAETEIR